MWGWVPGWTLAADPTPARYQAAGAALGRVHAAFARLPASSDPTPQVAVWRAPDLAGLRARIDRLLAVGADRIARGEGDAFDATARATLTERRQSLHHLPRLINDLPELSAQVLHGDYSALNLLFDGDRLTAVVDFSPPDPFLLSYELSRIAFTPDTVTGALDWEDTACRGGRRVRRDQSGGVPGRYPGVCPGHRGTSAGQPPRSRGPLPEAWAVPRRPRPVLGPPPPHRCRTPRLTARPRGTTRRGDPVKAPVDLAAVRGLRASPVAGGGESSPRRQRHVAVRRRRRFRAKGADRDR